MVRSTLAISAVLLFTMVMLAAARASADVPPIDVCNKVGEACETEDGRKGTCTASTCSRLVYGGEPEPVVTREGEVPAEPRDPGPRSVDYDCNRCVASSAARTEQASSPSTTSTSSRCNAVGPAWPMLLLALTLLRRRRHS